MRVDLFVYLFIFVACIQECSGRTPGSVLSGTLLYLLLIGLFCLFFYIFGNVHSLFLALL